MELLLVLTEDLINDYLAHAAATRRLQSSTLENYREDLNNLRKMVDGLSPEAILEWVQYGRDGSQLAPSTSNRRLAIVRGFSKYLLEQGWIASDPTEGIGRARHVRVRRTTLGPDDLRRLVAAARDSRDDWLAQRDVAIILVFFYTGLRLAELLALDTVQVDLAGGVLRSARRKGGHLTDEYLPKSACMALTDYLAVRPCQTESASLILTSRLARPTSRAIQKRMARMGRAAGIRTRVHPHALRHAHATSLNRNGVSLSIIQDSLNHASLKTTQRYIHLSDGEIRNARDRLPSLF